jgi:hypothetical protein
MQGFRCGGAKEKKIESDISARWPLNGVGRYLSFFKFFGEIFLWQFCAFLNKGSSKTP